MLRYHELRIGGGLRAAASQETEEQSFEYRPRTNSCVALTRTVLKHGFTLLQAEKRERPRLTVRPNRALVTCTAEER